MNKKELIDAVAAQTGRPKSETDQTLTALLAAIRQSVIQGEPVLLVGFGTFKTGQSAARTGRNPATGQALQIAAGKTVRFKAGKAFKAAVNVKAAAKKGAGKKAYKKSTSLFGGWVARPN